MKRLLTLCLLLASLLNFAQIPNSGFEYWNNDPRPIDWDNNSYPLTLPPYDPYIVRQDSDAYLGNYSAQLFANGVFKAYAINTFPVVFHPNYLSAVVKVDFPPCVNDVNFPEKDTVSIKVELLNNGAVVDQGFWQSLASNFTWSQIVIPVSQNATTFDSCRITLLGGMVNQGGCGIVAATTKFNIDHLQIFYGQSTNCVDTGVINPLVLCPAIVAPVCGCNGVTYNNECEAYYVHGITSWSSGACNPQETCIDSSQICDTCACFQIYNPVCGCNGVTYSNSCFASIAGVTAYTQGPCGAAIDTCNAYFSFGKLVDTVNFFNASTDLVTAAWHWDFGDGDTSNQQSPTHIYAQDGDYNVCLTISGTTAGNNPCSDTYCTNIYITHSCIDTSLICPPGSLCCDAPLFEPVCGCDGVTYDNGCVANLLFGITNSTPGPCAFDNIKTVSNSFSLYIMPVPAYDKLTANYNISSQSNIQLTIVSSIGQIVKTITPGIQYQGKHSVEIDINDIAEGVYMLDIKNEKGEHSIRKFVKQ